MYPQFRKKPHSLQVKSLYDRVGINHLVRLEIMDQLRKRLKRNIALLGGGGGGSLGTCLGREIESVC